jgi:hypothetical protein
MFKQGELLPCVSRHLKLTAENGHQMELFLLLPSQAAVPHDKQRRQEPAQCGRYPASKNPCPSIRMVSVHLPEVGLMDVDERNNRIEGKSRRIETGYPVTHRMAVGCRTGLLTLLAAIRLP